MDNYPYYESIYFCPQGWKKIINNYYEKGELK